MDVWLLVSSFLFLKLCSASFHEQYRVPSYVDTKWESFVSGSTEYLIQNSLVTWENAMILCRGYHNATLAVVDTREKAEFLAEALSESQFDITAVWVGARRESAEDPAGYRWAPGMELRRTASDVLASERDENLNRRYPVWLNRTHVPVPEGGADCVALERVNHDRPVFLDLSCTLMRPFACQKEAQPAAQVSQVHIVRCRAGLYHLFNGKLTWHEAAAFCVLRGMTLANIASMKCLKKLGMTMLKNRPSMENAWVGAKGSLGKWTWIDTGVNLFQTPDLGDVSPSIWPPMRDRNNVKQSGCLQLDRHAAHSPVFMEARCDRKMQFICYEGALSTKTQAATPSDDFFYYILVKKRFYWQHAYENCLKMNGTLANLDNNDILVQLLLLMGENKEEPIEHIWISGRLNMTKDVFTDAISYAWYNPNNAKRIPDPKAFGDSTIGLYMPPWLDEEFNMDNSCLNLDRQDHLIGLVYGLPCETAQYSVCMIDKSLKPPSVSLMTGKTVVETTSDTGYDSS
ncbi:unnamed protein product [Arctia plantaginis]|uniref:C-type lectin domain-containing protein n=1 Tax=Arctia plantaginis TaxID=874455 RepID=A0A8S1BQC1_ARCPL|nr:unnamed protein product [Arctia plantaginis]